MAERLCIQGEPTGRLPVPRLVAAFERFVVALLIRRVKGYDIFANIAEIKAKLEAGIYVGEYEFQLDLYLNVFGSGHDGHFIFYPDALSRVFAFTRPKALVSVSEDGASLPVIKLYGRSGLLRTAPLR